MRLLCVLIGAIIVYAVSWVVWWSLLYFHIFPLDQILTKLSIWRLESPFNTLVICGPPVLPAIIAAWVVFQRTGTRSQ